MTDSGARPLTASLHFWSLLGRSIPCERRQPLQECRQGLRSSLPGRGSLWSRPRKCEELLWLVGRCEEAAAVIDGDDGIGIAVALQQRPVKDPRSC